MNNYINCHTHSFSPGCAPKDILQLGTKLGDNGASLLESLLRTKLGQKLLSFNYRNNMVERYAEFLKIGTMATQRAVFEHNLKGYDNSWLAGTKFVVLTMDMDYMTDPENKPNMDFDAQLEEVKILKQTYPDRIFPFLGIDPRNPRNLDFSNNVQRLFETKTFSGIKLYPSQGFFPFDPRLDIVYNYAEANNIPIMTHCTRSGSFYIGRNVKQLIPDRPASLNPSHPAMQAIYKRISLYKNTTDKTFTSNARICNVFLHPENYLPVLDKYKNLKLCFAHLGGVMEVTALHNTNKKELKLFKELMAFENATKSWYEIIRDEILNVYTNTYSDISYTLSSKQAMQLVNADLTAKKLPEDKILFGTDYFMVEREMYEQSAIAVAQQTISPEYFNKMIVDNNKKYLFGTI
jgi:uncharacterized protein